MTKLAAALAAPLLLTLAACGGSTTTTPTPSASASVDHEAIQRAALQMAWDKSTKAQHTAMCKEYLSDPAQAWSDFTETSDNKFTSDVFAAFMGDKCGT